MLPSLIANHFEEVRPASPLLEMINFISMGASSSNVKSRNNRMISWFVPHSVPSVVVLTNNNMVGLFVYVVTLSLCIAAWVLASQEGVFVCVLSKVISWFFQPID